MGVNAKFWGVRGSVPAPLSPDEVRKKVQFAVQRAKEGRPLTFEQESTYGGNTTCIEVIAGTETFILDMGTGVRELGKQQARRLFQAKAAGNPRPQLRGTVLQSHVHWDHIQGFPFWAPLHLSRREFDCSFEIYGGKRWDSQLDLVYRGQMSPPEFPVNLEELEEVKMHLKFQTIFDEWERSFDDRDGKGKVDVLARKLFHPQETFGYRIEHGGRVLAFTTDHEPHAAGVPRGLAELVQGADLWITDCQYTRDEYMGKNGPQKMGWGHSYPDYIAEVAREARPKRIATMHHDPDSSDDRIRTIAEAVQEISKIETSAAHEGLELDVP